MALEQYAAPGLNLNLEPEWSWAHSITGADPSIMPASVKTPYSTSVSLHVHTGFRVCVYTNMTRYVTLYIYMQIYIYICTYIYIYISSLHTYSCIISPIQIMHVAGVLDLAHVTS